MSDLTARFLKDPATVGWVESLKAANSARVGTILSYDARSPDEAAENMRIGADVGLPANVVASDPAAFKRQAAQKKATAALSGAPKTARWLEDLNNGVLAKDDLDNLSWFEKSVVRSEGALTRSVGRGIVRLGAIPDEATARSASQRLQDYGKDFDAIYAEELAKIGGEAAPASTRVTAMLVAQERAKRVEGMTEADRADVLQRGATALSDARSTLDRAASIEMNETGTRFRDVTLANAENTFLGTIKAFASDPVGGASFVAQTAAEVLPILVASSAGTIATRSPAVGAGIMAGGSFLIENSNSAMEFLQEKGVDLSTPESAALVLDNAELMREAADRGLTRGLIIAMFDAVSLGVAGQTIAKSPMGEVVVQGLAQMFFGGAGEGVAQYASGQEIDWQDIVIEGLAELATAPIEVGGVAGRGFLRNLSRASKSGTTAESLDELDAMVAESKLKERSPEKFKEALEAQGEPDYHVPAEDLREYFQAKDMTFSNEMLESWGIDPIEFDAAEASGGDVAISRSTYATNISNTEDAAWFREHATREDGEMSVAQAARFNSEVRETLERAFEDAEAQRANDMAVRADDVKVYDSVFSQLRAAGRTRDVADSEARVWSSFWRTMGERYGMNPMDLAMAMGVSIRGPQTPDVARRRNDLDIKLNTLRANPDRALRPTGLSLLEFVRDEGGVADVGGDVEAMDAPKGVVGETRAEYEARRAQPDMMGAKASRAKGLDELGRAAIEAGYFPEYMGGADIQADGTVVDEAAVLLDAIQRAVAGEAIYPQGQGPDADLTALYEALSERGIDLAMSNDEIVAALDQTDGQQYDQSGRLLTDTPEFRAWFGDSKVVDEDGQPLVVYHGTRSDFEAFDSGTIGSAQEGRLFNGRGFYFSDVSRDAKSYGKNVVEAYLRIENPADLRDKSTILDVMADTVPLGQEMTVAQIREDYEQAQSTLNIEDVLVEEERPGFFRVQWKSNGEWHSPSYRGLISSLEMEGDPSGMKFAKRNALPLNPERITLSDFSPEQVTEAVKAGGYDGVIAPGSIGTSGDEYVAFSPEQIKSIHNRGTFAPNDPRILYQGGVTESPLYTVHNLSAEKLPAVKQALEEGYTTESEGALRSAVKSRTLFQKYQGNGSKRGSIVLPTGGLESGQTIINLFESADLSTFLHESGHFFLEAFTALATSEKSPQAMRDDLAAIHKFLGVDDGAPLETGHHEKWARGFEAYLMEGKAPSLELSDAFGRFKAWLTRIYRSIAGLNVKLTPEIREVMDRMLATDAEIATARETQQMSLLFTDQAASGMSDAAWSTYQRMARRSEEQASQALLEKTMAKVRREKEKWFRDERKDVRKEVTERINSQREYRLIEMLANQKWIGSDEAVPDFQIDRNELVETFGDGVLAELSRNKLGGNRAIYGPDGSSLREIADFFGFANPTEMVETLQNTGKRRDAIELETDRIMSDRYGDPLNDGSIEEEALAAIHSEQQAQTVASEARHLAQRAGKSTRNLTAKVFRQRARMMLGRMSVKEAIRPDAFLAAERKAAKLAEDAFARVARGRNAGEALAAAAKHKEQQLLNHYLYMESRDLSKVVASKREKMRNYSKASVREKLDGGYIEQIDALLDGYDFRVRSAGQIQRSESLREFVDRMTEEGRAGELAIDERLLNEAQRKHYTRLSVDELRGLFDTIENIDHMGRYKQTLMDRQKSRDLREVTTGFAEAVRGRFGSGKSGSQQGYVRKFFNLLFTVDTMMVDIDGTEFGATYEAFKAPIDAGQALEQKMAVEMAHATDKIFKAYSAKELADMQKPKVRAGGNGHAWSKIEIMSLALNAGHVEGRNRILEATVHPERRLTPDQLDATLAVLDRKDWEFVNAVVAQVNSYWPELAAVTKRRTGVEPKKVEALPIETKFGTQPGGYYPIKYDQEKAPRTAQHEQSAWDQYRASGALGAPKVRAGMTMARQGSSNGQTLSYDLNVMFTHMRDTIRVITLSEAIDNAGRILRFADRGDGPSTGSVVGAAFMEAGQKDMFNVLGLFLKDVAQGPVYNTDPLNAASRFIKNNFTMSKLAFNVKTMALQMTGIAQSAAVVGKKNMIVGYRNYLANPAGGIAFAMEKSPFMAERKTSFQKDIYDQVNDVKISSPLSKRTSKAKNVIGKAGFWGLMKTQFLTVDVPTWIAAYDAEMKKGTDEETAVRRADRIVARSQGSGLLADRTALERGTVSENMRQSDFVRLWTTLSSYMVTKMNRGYIVTQKARRDVQDADNIGQALGVVANMTTDLMLLYVAEGIMMGLGYALMAGGDADDEDLLAFILENAASSVVSGVPILSGTYNAYQGYGGGGVLATVLEMPANVMVQVAQGENDRAFRRSVSDGIGIITGFPSTFAHRIGEGLFGDSDVSPAEMMFGVNPLTR